MGVENNLIALAKADLDVSEIVLGTTNDELKQNVAAYHTEQAIEKIVKHLIIIKRGYGNNTHDIGQLVLDAKKEGIDLPEWIAQNAYEISRWSTTIRYNSNFKTNRDKINDFNEKLNEWIEELAL